MPKRHPPLPDMDSSLAGAILSARNARDLKGAAEILAESRLFGPASSLLILGCEEAIKAAVLTARGYGMPVKPHDVGRMLRDHKIRYGALIMILTLTPTLGPLVSGLVEQVDDTDDLLATREHLMNCLVPVVDDFVANLPAFWEALDNNPDVRWWADADLYKNLGVYVDQHGTSWNTPADANRESYEDVGTHAEYVFAEVLPFVDEWLAYTPDAVAQIRDVGHSIHAELSSLLDAKYSGRDA